MSKKMSSLSRLFLCSIILIAVSFSCKKRSQSSYPLPVSIQYRIIASNGVSQATSIIYTNETGGLTNLTNQNLPFSKSLSTTVTRGDAFTLRGDASGAGSLKLEILVNNNVVKTATYTGSSVITGQITYQFQ
ncbi:hypothetical protein IQ13_2795 [Lacibacter cauensis]|uniref:Uncharacterized protein n=2 Tax=Lacibacter cauensis TaxID=510947 RepID=A0A562SH36_9BACT|nr:hypothetical protein IQ13_2795 [Lacibacter cauensis]